MTEYKCDMCNYNTNRNWAYKRHLQSKKHIKNLDPDTVEKVYSCPECEYTANSRQALYSHKKSHDDYEIHRYKCNLCNVTVRDIQMYDQHKKGLPHCKRTTKMIRDIKNKLLEEYRGKDLDKNYYDKLSLEKFKLRGMACQKLKETIKVRKNDKRRARLQKVRQIMQTSQINQLIDKWSPEEWKIELTMVEQYNLENYKQLFEQLKLLDKEKPEMLYYDAYKDDFKDMHLLPENDIIDNSYSLIADICYDYGM